jgi:hypothetical protein
MSNVTNLYDRYINLTFVSKNGNMCSIVTPKTGVKPNIAVQLKTEPSDMVSQFTISIMNCTLDVNLSEFNYIKVEMGYSSSNEAFAFEGQIYSVFQEAPNPNGILSFQGEVGYTTAYVNSMPLSISLPEDPIAIEDLINLVLNNINTAMRAASGKPNTTLILETGRIPSDWTGQTLEFAGSTEQFPNAYSAVSWLNTVLLSYAYSKELPPVFTFLTEDRMIISSNVASGKGPTLLSLSLVNSIAAQGTHVIVNCPFVPSIKADSCFYLTARNYTAVLNVDKITALEPITLLKVYQSEIKFATAGTNQMRLDCIKLDTNKDGQLSSLNLLYQG